MTSLRRRVQRVLARRPGAVRTGPDRALGLGVWRRDHDTLRRAVDRAHDVVAGSPPPLRAELAAVLDVLARTTESAQVVAEGVQLARPTDTMDVPGGDGGRWLDVHRALSRAGQLAAQSAQAAFMARTMPAERGAAVAAAERAAGRARDQVRLAETVLAELTTRG